MFKPLTKNELAERIQKLALKRFVILRMIRLHRLNKRLDCANRAEAYLKTGK